MILGVHRSSSKAFPEEDDSSIEETVFELLFFFKGPILIPNEVWSLSWFMDNPQIKNKVLRDLTEDQITLLQVVCEDIVYCSREFDLRRSNNDYKTCLKQKLNNYDAESIKKLNESFIKVLPDFLTKNIKY